jgi:polynucleotide 5'-kinase involved in rRNA processing
VELATSPHVRERSREDRIARRQERLARYFDGTHTRQVCLRRLAVYDLERFTTGALLAFQDAAGFTLALGAVEEADRSGATCTVRTPLPDLDSVRSVRFGAARWDCTNNREW